MKLSSIIKKKYIFIAILISSCSILFGYYYSKSYRINKNLNFLFDGLIRDFNQISELALDNLKRNEILKEFERYKSNFNEYKKVKITLLKRLDNLTIGDTIFFSVYKKKYKTKIQKLQLAHRKATKKMKYFFANKFKDDLHIQTLRRELQSKLHLLFSLKVK